ncbi:MAG TPA: type II toxin-antitoxin system MqsA family antitoxin [Steroidobacteraceae bacterium]|jgi:HTH-type transcriptional regulator/antitoxin MqsA
MNNLSAAVCPVCEMGTLTPEVYSDEIQHNGKVIVVEDLERSRCDSCGADPVLTDQIKRNQVRICDAKRRGDGYLTSQEILNLRNRLQLSQPDASALFGGGPNAFSKYERGEVVQSLPMDRLLRLVSTFPWIAEFLRPLAGLESRVANSHCYANAQDTVSLNDPQYTSKRVRGTRVVVTSEDRKQEGGITSLADWRKKKVA